MQCVWVLTACQQRHKATNLVTWVTMASLLWGADTFWVVSVEPLSLNQFVNAPSPCRPRNIDLGRKGNLLNRGELSANLNWLLQAPVAFLPNRGFSVIYQQLFRRHPRQHVITIQYGSLLLRGRCSLSTTSDPWPQCDREKREQRWESISHTQPTRLHVQITIFFMSHATVQTSFQSILFYPAKSMRIHTDALSRLSWQLSYTSSDLSLGMPLGKTKIQIQDVICPLVVSHVLTAHIICKYIFITFSFYGQASAVGLEAVL